MPGNRQTARKGTKGATINNLTLHIITSRRDVYGNVYAAFTARDEDGRTVSGTAPSVGSITGAEFDVLGRWPSTGEPRWTVYESELPIRQFNRATKGDKYAGCRPAEILAFIRDGIEGTP